MTPVLIKISQARPLCLFTYYTHAPPNPSDYPPPTSLPLLFSIMARTSRDPFSPPSSSMKKKGGGRKKVAGESAKADGSAGTPKKKTTTSANQTKKKNPPELSNIEESPPINQRKAPPEGIMPSLVPHTRQNTVRSTRNALPRPPAHVYIGNDPLESTIWANVLPSLPPFDGNIQPLDHTSPHKYPPASFVAAAACAASPANMRRSTTY